MYKLIIPFGATEVKTVKRLSDNVFIPLDTDNTDYQAYLKWLDGYELTDAGLVKTSNGNQPLPADN